MDEWFEHNPFIGFVPWIIYWVVAESPSTWLFGALCAVLSAVILGISAARGGPRLLEIVTIVFFFAITAAGVIVGAADRDWMDTYSTTLSSGVLAAMAAGSLLFTPFTEQYASVDRTMQGWEKAAFRQTNKTLTLMWALVFALIAALGYVAARMPETDDWTNWVIPVVVIVGAVGMTQAYPTRVRERARPVG